MRSEKLLDIIGEISDDYIIESTPKVRQVKRHVLKKWYALASCFALIIIGLAVLSNNTLIKKSPDFDLAQSTGTVSVKYIGQNEIPKDINISGMLEDIPENELFTRYKIVAFKGEVKNIDNILIEYGTQLQYYSIATIKVEKSYKGDIESGSTVNILIPYAYQEGVSIEDSDTVEHLKVGMTGIFTPKVNDKIGIDDDFIQSGESRIVFADIAEYRFLDGTRWMFLDTDEGLIFDRSSYGKASYSKTLYDIEDYVNSMIFND